MSPRVLACLGAAAALVIVPTPARADTSIIKHPGAHADYVFEAEPHALVAPFDDFRPGVGFRGTFSILHNGFIRTINNSVGIGIGVDFTKDHFRVPIVMQWNFWLSRNWSVFGEPGGLVDLGKKPITLTMRIGHPTASVGVSFLL